MMSYVNDASPMNMAGGKWVELGKKSQQLVMVSISMQAEHVCKRACIRLVKIPFGNLTTRNQTKTAMLQFSRSSGCLYFYAFFKFKYKYKYN